MSKQAEEIAKDLLCPGTEVSGNSKILAQAVLDQEKQIMLMQAMGQLQAEALREAKDIIDDKASDLKMDWVRSECTCDAVVAWLAKYGSMIGGSDGT